MRSRPNPYSFDRQRFESPMDLVRYKDSKNEPNYFSDVQFDGPSDIYVLKSYLEGSTPPARPVSDPPPAPVRRQVTPVAAPVAAFMPDREEYDSDDFESPFSDVDDDPSNRRERRPRPAGPTRQARGVVNVESPVTYLQGKVIGCSIGGMVAYCRPEPNESHAQALTRGGLTRGKASAVIDALKAAGLNQSWPGRDPNSPEARKAQQILAEVGGFVCRR